MASYTSYLNLEKPTTSETFNLLKINQNWDKIDAGVSALNSNLGAMVPSKLLQTDNASFTLTIGNTERHFIVIMAANAAARALVLAVSTASDGTITVAEIYKGSTVTYNVSTAGKIVVTQNTTTRSTVADFALTGSYVSIE